MDNKLVEVKTYNEEGYRPLVSYGTWRVAVLNYIDELLPANICTLERHTDTDEVFILASGKAMLVIGGCDKEIASLSSLEIRIGEINNVKKDVWHTVLLSQDAHIVIVENDNTCTENSEYFTLTPALKSDLLRIATGFESAGK